MNKLKPTFKTYVPLKDGKRVVIIAQGANVMSKPKPTFETYVSLKDGKRVVHIDTIDRPSQPVLRVYVNNRLLWEGFADGSEIYGDIKR